MSTPTTENQPQIQENKPNEKELNFRILEAQYKKQLEQERNLRLEAEKKAKEVSEKQKPEEDDDYSEDPYIDGRKLKKKLDRFSEQTKATTQNDIQVAVKQALEEERKKSWLKNNPDFYEVIQHADKFAQLDEDWAESILNIPDNFERQKIVYKSIKHMGLNKPPEERKNSIQDKVNSNARNPGYQPSNVSPAPYSSYVVPGDKRYSVEEQKNAYENVMKRLQGSRR